MMISTTLANAVIDELLIHQPARALFGAALYNLIAEVSGEEPLPPLFVSFYCHDSEVAPRVRIQ